MTASAPGYKNLHPDLTLNFMLNRLAADIPAGELEVFAKRVETLDDFVREALREAGEREREGRPLEAAYFFRGAEFFLPPDAPRKAESYDRYLELFDATHPEVAAWRAAADYEGGVLPLIDIPAKGRERDVILACSGFDGLIEEMVGRMQSFAGAGYRVVLFEGPGQGGALRRSGSHMTHEWERPVGAILDQLGIDACTLIGVSLGGYLAPRAAAFEPRIQRVVSWGAMYDFFECFKARVGEEGFAQLKGLIEKGERSILNAAIAASQESTVRWASRHGMHVSGAEDPFGFYRWAMDLNLKDVSHLIRQDALILMGSNDHLVPRDQLYRQAEALTHARSVTTRLFTEAEQAAEHCQVTNQGLVVAEISRWLEGLERRDAA